MNFLISIPVIKHKKSSIILIMIFILSFSLSLINMRNLFPATARYKSLVFLFPFLELFFAIFLTDIPIIAD